MYTPPVYRRPRGRPLERGVDPVRNVMLTLDERSIRLLRALGDGNVSRGARLAARVAYDRWQRLGSLDGLF